MKTKYCNPQLTTRKTTLGESQFFVIKLNKNAHNSVVVK